MNSEREDRKQRDQRAVEWKMFRRDALLSQADLADALGCSRRTVVSVESGETVNPRPSLLRAFRTLRRKHEHARQQQAKQGGMPWNPSWSRSSFRDRSPASR